MPQMSSSSGSVKQKQEEELKTLLVTELLKAKEQEINAAKAGEVTAIERLRKCKQRLKDALSKQNELRTELNELRVETGKADEADGDHLALDYKRQAVDAESACKAAQNECDTLKKDIAELKIESKGSIEKYKTRFKIAKADHEQAESSCRRLQSELEESRKECEALRSTLTGHAASQSRISISEIRIEIDQKLSSALNNLPVVANHPSQDLKPIGWHLKETMGFLHKDILASIDGPRRRTFLESHIIFNGKNRQHGYIICPQMGLKSADRLGGARWVKNNIPFRYYEAFEAFYRRDGQWYYIGTYKGFLVCDAHWDTFSRWPDQVISDLMSSTIIGSARDRNDPDRCQRMREMYRSGEAVAYYLGLQCVGFSSDLYQHLLRASEAAEESGLGEKEPQHSKRLREDDPTESQGPNKKQKNDMQSTPRDIKSEA